MDEQHQHLIDLVMAAAEKHDDFALLTQVHAASSSFNARYDQARQTSSARELFGSPLQEHAIFWSNLADRADQGLLTTATIKSAQKIEKGA